jgi:hypothetical protein
MRETLLLIKYLRLDGYEVIIKPENNQPIEYLFKKGFEDYFSHPIMIKIYEISINIITNLISNKIQKHLDQNKKLNTSNIYIYNDNSKQTYNYFGQAQSSEKMNLIENNRKDLINNYKKCFEIKPPYLELPVPILLQHKPNIIGWCKLWIDNNSIMAEGIINDKTVKRRISQNRLKGASITGIATKSVCSICNSNFVYCNHLPHVNYNGIICYNSITESEFVEMSIVKEPVNTACLNAFK